MKNEFTYLLVATFLGSFLIGCAEFNLKTENDYEEAFFNLGKQIRPIEKEKVKCVISIESPGLLDDIGTLADARLNYRLVRDVSIPFAGVDVEGNSNHIYIPSYRDCEKPLKIATRLIKKEKPSQFPIIKVEGPEVLDFLEISYVDED